MATKRLCSEKTRQVYFPGSIGRVPIPESPNGKTGRLIGVRSNVCVLVCLLNRPVTTRNVNSLVQIREPKASKP